ncbi:MAG: hypothetical protein KDC26_13350, partial [Armatimonadetes bacterium]|nr:hypothetical protein [Armatimonadota bacterium]
LEMLRKGPVDFEEIRRLAAERKRRPKSEAPEPFRHVVQIEVGTPKRSGLWGTLKRLFGGIG